VKIMPLRNIDKTVTVSYISITLQTILLSYMQFINYMIIKTVSHNNIYNYNRQLIIAFLVFNLLSSTSNIILIIRMFVHRIKFGYSENVNINEELWGKGKYINKMHGFISTCSFGNMILYCLITNQYLTNECTDYCGIMAIITYTFIMIISFIGFLLVVVCLLYCFIPNNSSRRPNIERERGTGSIRREVINITCIDDQINKNYLVIREGYGRQRILSALQNISPNIVYTFALINKEDETCPMCLENIEQNEAISAPCDRRHIFCKSCVKYYATLCTEKCKSLQCPICREPWENI